MSTNIEMRDVVESNLRRYLDLIVAGDLPAFQRAMRNHTCLNVSSPQVYDGRTPLHMAALKGKLEIAKVIIGSPGVSVQVVNAKDRFGYTPLHLAVRSGCVDLVRLLAESPLTTLDVAATSEQDDAATSEQDDAATSEQDDAATSEQDDAATSEQDDAAISEQEDDGKDCDGWTPLHLAARKGNVCILKILLQTYSNGQDNKPINIHATNWQGESALDIAKQSNHDPKFVEILECFDANWLQLERQKSANSINGILVGATVVASVTFTTLMQPPTAGLPAQEHSLTGGGTAADQSPVHLLNIQPEHTIGLLIIVTSFCFSVSILSFIVGINGLLSSTKTLKEEVHLLRKSVRRASQLMFAAILCLMLAAFLGSMPTFHVMVPHRHMAIKVFAGIAIVGMPFLITFILLPLIYYS